MKARTMAAVLTGLMLATPVWAGDTPDLNAPRNWGATLRADAQTLHDAVIDSHPGVYDKDNPGFRAKVDDGLALALKRAGTAKTVGAWWWAMRGYIASFDDGHVQINLADRSYNFATQWPGFLTGYEGKDQVVRDVDAGDASAPPVGARLIGCDGLSADKLAEKRLGAFRGRWFLESQHVDFGSLLFVDIANPYLGNMKSCRFEANGKTQTYKLHWRTISADDLAKARTAVEHRGSYDFAEKTLDDGGRWYEMPDFDGSTDSDTHNHMTQIIADIAADTQVRDAPYIILDLRNNGGGSSRWGRDLAGALWGADWVAAHDLPPVISIDWRVSDANIAQMQAYDDEMRKGGESADVVAYIDTTRDGMIAAKKAGQTYWIEKDDDAQTPKPANAPLLVKGRVYVLTDSQCASACLDTVDLWKALGAVQIGRETSADTVYMEIREQDLPSGLAKAYLPMKVWRGRQRGNNVPQEPAHVFDGNMSDDAALLAWIRTLN